MWCIGVAAAGRRLPLSSSWMFLRMVFMRLISSIVVWGRSLAPERLERTFPSNLASLCP